MDRNQTIGIILITILIFAWSYFNAPSSEELSEIQRRQDSIALVQNESSHLSDSQSSSLTTTGDNPEIPERVEDSLSSQELGLVNSARKQGPFGIYFQGEESFTILENDLIKIKFSNKGAQIREVELKSYKKVRKTPEGIIDDGPVKLLEDELNRMYWTLPFGHPGGNSTSTDKLFFTTQKPNKESVIFSTEGLDGKLIQIQYSLNPNSYSLGHKLSIKGVDEDKEDMPIQFNWVNYLDKIEQNEEYERVYSTVYFKESSDDPDYCSCRSDDLENIARPIEWVSHANQFFNTTIIPDQAFSSGELETVVFDETNDNLKLLKSSLLLEQSRQTEGNYNFTWYLGPNDFEQLASFDKELEMIVPFGWSIFGTINRWVIRPLFNFLFNVFGSAGIAIIILTLLVKFALYPLTYKMLHSQAKMSVLKPEMEKIRHKFKDKPQDQQMEMMKLYREFGVNPLGGCMPMVLQMPIWFALYRFFPASLEFRQASFWWAHDLSSFDAIAFLPFEIPFFGSHVSLFTLLWSITMLIYAVYNTKLMDATTANNPMLKYMQYVTPVMFIFFFNNYASGLTAYLFFSTLTNILQTVGTKELIFDDTKILAQLEANKNKPKKKNSFQERLEAAMKEQQKKQQTRSNKRK